MIKLERFPKPLFLTGDKVKELTEEYTRSGFSVWNIEHIKEPLLRSSFGKCSYCECDLTEESKYMEVEHFEDKKHNPDKVVTWENLLPACKKCNGSKGTHDVISEPILNPYVNDPREHLAIRFYRMRGLTQLGKNSIDVVGLNNQERLVLKRFEIGSQIAESIEMAWERYSTYKSNDRTQSKNRLISLVEGILAECQPKAIYAATTSTVVLSDRSFIGLIAALKNDDLWNDDLETLYESGKELVLEFA
ncbi:HNH endonuclease [Marinobacter bryozoorum]|uniref:HNH endonuclease n=1 Tax=Marinobacter bryozoorum TaxID=256324 RepID=UPI00200465D4|nr:HNH endonuclease [Marinobacter bryozoorum]MCK7546183.1 HNH endonuclease [Marinobacter bryozoorum]